MSPASPAQRSPRPQVPRPLFAASVLAHFPKFKCMTQQKLWTSDCCNFRKVPQLMRSFFITLQLPYEFRCLPCPLAFGFYGHPCSPGWDLALGTHHSTSCLPGLFYCLCSHDTLCGLSLWGTAGTPVPPEGPDTEDVQSHMLHE